MNLFIKKYLNLALCLVLLCSMDCATVPGKPPVTPADSQPAQAAHSRKMSTPSYAGGGAVIFVLNQINTSTHKDAVNQIIRVFGENNAPLDVALKTLPQSAAYDSSARELTYYTDAGIIDVSVDGYSVSWLKPQALYASPEYNTLAASLTTTRDQIKNIFGAPPLACILPPEAVNEINYRALHDSGFKVICSINADALPAIQATLWSGTVGANGLYLLPIVGSIDSAIGSESIPKLLDDARQSINTLGVTVVEIQVASILDGKNKADGAKLVQLANLIKSCQQLGAITTLENWYQYVTGCPSDATGIKRPLPPYDGGPVIIFRLDDVSKGYREEVVQEIIKLFQRNGVPLDCGVVSNVDGTDSYEIPWLKQYVDQNAVGISVHGYDWTFYQLDITKSYLARIEDDACMNTATARTETEKAKLTYTDLKSKLVQSRCKYLKYFGINPVSFTVPTDYYDEQGYKAIQDAGYKVFSVHRSEEPCPSADPVNYSCRSDTANGMYRIPTGSDLCIWNKCAWTDVIDLNKPMAQKDYCIYIDAWGESIEYNDYGITICSTLMSLGVAAVSLHPDCFIDKAGKPDMAKLEKVDTIIKWFKSFATIMTFEQWYRYRTGGK